MWTHSWVPWCWAHELLDSTYLFKRFPGFVCKISVARAVAIGCGWYLLADVHDYVVLYPGCGRIKCQKGRCKALGRLGQWLCVFGEESPMMRIHSVSNLQYKIECANDYHNVRVHTTTLFFVFWKKSWLFAVLLGGNHPFLTVRSFPWLFRWFVVALSIWKYFWTSAFSKSIRAEKISCFLKKKKVQTFGKHTKKTAVPNVDAQWYALRSSMKNPDGLSGPHSFLTRSSSLELCERAIPMAGAASSSSDGRELVNVLMRLKPGLLPPSMFGGAPLWKAWFIPFGKGSGGFMLVVAFDTLEFEASILDKSCIEMLLLSFRGRDCSRLTNAISSSSNK